MKQVIRQLEHVRRVGRLLLFVQLLFQWLAAVLAVALACGLLDFALRLPGWLRLAIGVSVAGAALIWLLRRLARALGFAPDLSILALRAERLYPQLSGALASGVEFAMHPDDYADPQRTHAMATASIAHAQQRLSGASLAKLIDMTRTMRISVVAVLVMLVAASVAAAAPDASLLAMRRWLAPLGDAQWPRRTDMSSLVADTVWPSDTPVRMLASVDRGYRSGMRAWAVYRLVGPAGAQPWQSVLMSEQHDAAGARRNTFERLVDLSADLAAIPGGAGGMTLEFYFEAGDTRTAAQAVKLVPRPAIEAVTVFIDPPEYAKGLVDAQIVAMEQQSARVATASGLAGSQVRVLIELNKPLPDPAGRWDMLLPGFAALSDAKLTATGAARLSGPAPTPTSTTTSTTAPSPGGPHPTFELAFTLKQTMQSAIHLVDEHGLTNLSERLYRLEAIEDKPPAVQLSEPAADESVLASAVVDLQGVARDDVGVESLRLEATLPASALPDDADAAKKPAVNATLHEATGRADALNAQYKLDLAALKLKPGDELVLAALARDVFDLDGRRHDPVRSALRRLRIVDEATLIGQIRTELAGMRQQAIRLDTRQRDLLDVPADKAHQQQEQLSQTLNRLSSLVESLNQRVARNRLNEAQLNELLNQSGRMMQQAESSSRSASQKLEQARREPAKADDLRQQARKDQQDVNSRLADLISLLDQGKDALTLQLQLRQLATMQEQLANDTRQLLPRTLGRNPDELAPGQKQDLENLANRQQSLSEQAKTLTKQMQAGAEALRKQSSAPRDQASAEALAQAAAIAQRQGLEQTMQQAAQSARQNRLSQAGQQQGQSQDVIQQMLDQLKDQQRKQQEILRRMLTRLADTIARLVAQQKAQIELLNKAQVLTSLDEPLAALRRSTMAAEQLARQSPQTAEVGDLLAKAVVSQADGITALRTDDHIKARVGERDALASLEAALAKVRELQNKAQQQQAQQQREQLRKEYERLALEEEQIRKETAALTGVAEPSRQQRQQMLQLGNRQADLRLAAEKLRQDNEEIGQTLLFVHLHDRIDKAAAQVVAQLRTAAADEASVTQQRRIAQDLKMMAGALAQAKKDADEFARQSGGGGGGGGGSGAKPPLVPPAAELKLLRGMQASIYQSTRTLNDQPAKPEDAPVRQRALLELGSEQRELGGLGEKLIEKLEQSSLPTGPPDLQPKPNTGPKPGGDSKPGDNPGPDTNPKPGEDPKP